MFTDDGTRDCSFTCRPASGKPGGTDHVRLVRPDGSEIRTLLPGTADQCAAPCLSVGHRFLTALATATDPVPAAIDWSPNGEWLIGKAFYPDLRFTLIRVSTGERLPLNPGTVAFSMPAWKP